MKSVPAKQASSRGVNTYDLGERASYPPAPEYLPSSNYSNDDSNWQEKGTGQLQTGQLQTGQLQTGQLQTGQLQQIVEQGSIVESTQNGTANGGAVYYDDNEVLMHHFDQPLAVPHPDFKGPSAGKSAGGGEAGGGGAGAGAAVNPGVPLRAISISKRFCS